ncbi:MAG TPA: hypothetical protein VFO36_10965, partial [Nitrospiraceae bacterium]|nr:hypothetical protein [Nitrospiraceae bacterium]
KMLGLAAVAAAALMAFVGAGTASATQLTDGSGNVLGVGTAITGESEGTTTLHPPIGSISCNKSHVGGKVGDAGSATTTVSGTIEALSFTECNATVHVLKNGSLEVHTEGSSNNNNGTLTSTGAQVTVVYLGFHCIFSTNNTDLGTVTGSATTGGNATLDIKATIPRTGGSSGAFCGTTAAWTGSYKVTEPGTLNIH